MVTEVIVVGGGPAGLAAGIAVRAKGFDVVVADAARPPIDKACGEGLMPDTLDALEKLGVSLPAIGTFAFRGIRFLGAKASVDASFRVGFGVGVRRLLLHQLLIDRAQEVGVKMLWGARVTGMSPDGVLIDGRQIRSRWVIGADGQNSRVRRWAGLDRCVSESNRFGFRRHYRVAPWTDCMEIYWGEGCQMYVTPVSLEEVCVVLISRDSRLRLAQVEDRFPRLFDRLKGAAQATAERGAVTASRQLRNVVRGRVALLGDASGSVDAITGEGLSLSFQQAVIMADALESGNLKAYERWHRSSRRRPAFMASLMLMLDRVSWARERTIRALESRPETFASMLGMHVGAISSIEFLMRGILPLGWELLKT